MGRPGLSNHPKFRRLAYALGSAARARGHLELMWEVAYENGDPRLGDPISVEAAAQWDGARGALFEALRDAGGGPGRAGFIEERDGVWEVHDLYDHAPDYVRKRAKREAERRTTGRSLDAEVRSMTGQRPTNGGQQPENGTPRAPAPAPADPPAHAPAPAPARAEPPRADQPPLVDAMEALHQEKRGSPLDWGPPRRRMDREREVGDLAEKHGDAEVLRRLQNALTVPKGKFPYLGTVRDLVDQWGHYDAPFQAATGPPRTAHEVTGLRPAAAMSRAELDADAAETARWNEQWARAAEQRRAADGGTTTAGVAKAGGT